MPHIWNSNTYKDFNVQNFGNRLLSTLIFAISISAMSVYAQPKSIGLVSSFKGFAISYEHNLSKPDMFMEMSLAADASEMFLYRAERPGISVSTTWNRIFSTRTLQDGTEISFFAGPGITLGYGSDFKVGNGYFFGIKGRVGIECNFARRVIISAGISPVLGMHMIPHQEFLSLRYYKNGIFYSPIPEIGIRYRF